MPHHLYVPEKISLRERFTRSRVGRATLRLAIVVGFIGGVVAVEAPAAADSGQEYTVTDDAAGGVYARNSPHMGDTDRIVGKGIYPGDVVRLICGATNGDPVGPYNNTTWHKIVDETRPNEGEFWEDDHFFNTPNKPGELAPGESNCEQTPLATGQPSTGAAEIKSCYLNMKAPSLNLTFSYGGDHRYYGNAWQAAKNWTDLDTGITIKPASDSDGVYIRFKDVNIANGLYANVEIPQTADWEGPYKTVPPHPHVPKAIVIDVNKHNMDPANDFVRTYALTHELGHALGLAHTDKFCHYSDSSIMDAGSDDIPRRNFNTPTTYDRMELEQLYGLPIH